MTAFFSLKHRVHASTRLALVIALGWLASSQSIIADDSPPTVSTSAAPSPDGKNPYAWQSLFDGKTLDGWKIVDFGGQGEVYVEDGAIVMEMGNDMTGIRREGDVPKINFELQYEAMRTEGYDFFGTVTVPYNDSYFSFILGGWGGGVVGISSVDHYDAANNETARYMTFKKKAWYRVRLRVSESKIEAWVHELDAEGKPIRDPQKAADNTSDDRVVDLVTKDRQISTRMEVNPCRPFGFSTWCTEGRVRNIQWRVLRPGEVETLNEEAAEQHRGWLR